MPDFCPAPPGRRLLFALLLAGCLPAGALAAAPAAAAATPPTVLITGSNRGIGLAFASYYAEQGWRVIATCRSPERAKALATLAAAHDRLEIVELDITDAGELEALDRRLDGRPVDLLINNAAMLGETEPQEFGRLDYALFEQMLRVNLVGPLRVTEAFVDNVAASQRRQIVFLGSAAGSNGLLGPGLELYAYRSSKAGLHFAAHQLARTLAPRGITVGLLNPGIVDTKGVLDLKPGDPVPAVFQPLLPLIESGELQLIRPAESVAAMAELIDGLGPDTAGRFWNVDGQELPW
jgi:NAD(P)-dependent dehydrogenase (short-subunit alcohol dehydrogenase family)